MKDAHVNNTFYISSSLNEIILESQLVMAYSIDSKCYHSFYSPAKINEFEKSISLNCLNSEFGDASAASVNIVIPAAGEGSRFAKLGWKKPKPFIDVDKKPMIERVLENIKSANCTLNVLLRKEHIDEYPCIASALLNSCDNVIPVSSLTEGTASTVLLSRHIINTSQPLLIANSDQLVKFNVNDFISDCNKRNLDGSIVVFKDKTKNPKWSFAKINHEGLVIEVAEKSPISDMATVGIYLFAKGEQFVDAAFEMILSNTRVNKEFYVCPVYNFMIRNGARIGIYEVPSDAMFGLGTPDDLNYYLNDHSFPPSADSPFC